MFDPEILTSPDKYINECDKQINFAHHLIDYLQQYIKQLEAMKTMALSAKTLQEANPLNYMMQFFAQLNDSAAIKKDKPKDNKE
jgi:hypothetical protein